MRYIFSVIIVSVIFYAGIFLIRGNQNLKPALTVQPAQFAETTPMNVLLTSSAFEHNAMIPAQFTCDGNDVSPPLAISNVPPDTKSLALIMHDPDAPRAGGWTHWVKWNIPPETRVIEEGKEPSGVSGKSTGGTLSYEGPCPPSGTHRYVFKVYALDTTLTLPEGTTKERVEAAMAGHIVGERELIGLYARR